MADISTRESVAQAAVLTAEIVSTAGSMLGAEAAQALETGGDPEAAANTIAVTYAHQAVTGGVAPRMLPDFNSETGQSESYNALVKQAQVAVRAKAPTLTGEAMLDAVNEELIGGLTVSILNNPNTRAAFEKFAPALSGLARANDKRVTKIKRGQTTITETEVP